MIFNKEGQYQEKKIKFKKSKNPLISEIFLILREIYSSRGLCKYA